MGTATQTGVATGSLMIRFYDGTRQPVPEGSEILLKVFDGAQRQIVAKTYSQSFVVLRGLEIHDNFIDDYRIFASMKGYRDTGFFPVRILGGVILPVDLMFIPDEPNLNFGLAQWNDLAVTQPQWQQMLAAGASSADAAARRYSSLEDEPGGLRLACLLNVIEGMGKINLACGTALDYLREVKFEQLKQDRLFGFCDPELLNQVRVAEARGLFKRAPHALHPGATASYKQIQFGEANLQLTFHENNVKEGLVKLELDFDYFRDALAHLVLEVALNKTHHTLTDPREVYVLRWMAGQHAGMPAFDPLYRIEAA